MTDEQTLWNPEIELMDREEMKKLQLEKLKKQLIRVYEESPYYKQKFNRAGVDPYRFKSLEQYRDYPFFDKEEERVSQEASKAQQGHPLGMHITCDPKKVIRISSTSGTTGSPTFTGYTQKDREAVNETGARGLWRNGARPGAHIGTENDGGGDDGGNDGGNDPGGNDPGGNDPGRNDNGRDPTGGPSDNTVGNDG